MARVNVATKKPVSRTHEGAPAKRINGEQQLRRSVMACMLWEKTFYEEGQDIAIRIQESISNVDPEKVRDIAIEAREKFKLRHVPLLIVRQMARLEEYKYLVAETLERVIQRPDELAEFVAIYWKDKREPLSAQVKKGLARAFLKFNEYQLAKYNRDGAVKLRDVLFLCHAKPQDKAQEKLFKKLAEGTLKTPDTWEVALSAGKDKKATWKRLISEEKLGAMALLRNLRNMQEADVPQTLIAKALKKMQVERVLPYRFISAARYAPKLEPELEEAMYKCIKDKEQLSGRTVLLVDVSGSMNDNVGGRSEIRRVDAACGLAILLRELCEKVEIYAFSDKVFAIPPRNGFALRDIIVQKLGGGTYLGQAINTIKETKFDRLIVLTDEQSHDPVPNVKAASYLINVAAYKNGVGYGSWTHIDGWSEAVIDYIQQTER